MISSWYPSVSSTHSWDQHRMNATGTRHLFCAVPWYENSMGWGMPWWLTICSCIHMGLSVVSRHFSPEFWEANTLISLCLKRSIYLFKYYREKDRHKELIHQMYVTADDCKGQGKTWQKTGASFGSPPHGGKSPKTWDTYSCFSRATSRQFDGNWSRLDTNQYPRGSLILLAMPPQQLHDRLLSKKIKVQRCD